MLALNNIEVMYDGVILVLKGVSVNVKEGGITTLLGANGAGKTTTLKAISGVLRSERGDITKGSVEFDGRRIDGLAAHQIVKRGLVQVFEGRRVFEHLTTEENLVAGAHVQADRRRVTEGIERVYEYFPRLRERRSVQSGYLSGGEQQMLAIGRGLMGNPRLLLVDEVSLGLAPVVVRDIYRVLRTIAAEGTSTLVVDQDVSQIMELAQRVYCFRKGTVSLEGRPADLTRARIAAAYFGV